MLAITVVNLGLSYRFRARLSEAAHQAEEAGHDLNLLSQVLTAFEREPFTSPKLLQLQARLKTGIAFCLHRRSARSCRSPGGVSGVGSQSVRSRFRFCYLLPAANLSLPRRVSGAGVTGRSLRRIWLETVGELEALAALGGYTYEHPDDVFPEFVDKAPCFEAEALAHPLIPRNRAVTNDLHLSCDLQLMIVSGPNMAGKSTFLRGIAGSTQSDAPAEWRAGARQPG